MARQLVLVAALLVLGAVDVTFAMQSHEIIVSDRDATEGEFPHQVSLRDYKGHFCGGSLIANQYVLTAAHCIVDVVEPPFNGITVVTGTISSSEGGEDHLIKDVVIHPNYVHEILQNDIAIITLDAPITPNAYQRPIRLAVYDPPETAQVTLSGWGLTSNPGKVAPTLQRRTIYVLRNQRCQSYWQQTKIFDTNLCTLGVTGIGACIGDGGSALIYNGEIVGIASFVYACAQGMPDVYTRTSRYLDFINSTIKA